VVEYLSGLPVVSTPSVGGRDRVLDPAWSRIVDPSPGAIANAVADMIRRNIDPQRIRAGAFDRLRPDRIRLLNLIRTIYEQEGMPFPADDRAGVRASGNRRTRPSASG
jgi:glycosyltransferase involved in cell wall biosynthesis